MTKTLVLILLTYSATTFAQKENIIISTPKIGAIYVGFDNLIKVGFNGKKINNIQLVCEECDTIRPIALTKNEWLIRVDKVVPITLKVLNKRGMVIGEKDFKVFNLPEPNVYMDSIDAQSIITKVPNRINLKLDPYIPLHVGFLIKSWTMKINNKEYSGVGNSLTSEVINQINVTKSGILILNINYITPFGNKSINEIFEFRIE
jgi:hypothetical protein